MVEKTGEVEQDLKAKKIDETTFKKLSKEERRKIREKKRAESGMPTKMNRYLWFVLFFSNIVSFFDGWATVAIMLAMSGFGEVSANLVVALQKIGNPDLFTYFGVANSPLTFGIVFSPCLR